MRRFKTKPRDLKRLFRTYRNWNLWPRYTNARFIRIMNFGNHTQIRFSMIQTINDFNIKPFRPTLVAIAAKFEPKEATKAFQFFVSLGVRMLIAASTRSGSVDEETMAKVAAAVFKRDIKTIAKLKEALTDITPTDGEFSASFETATLSKGTLARYYLRSLEKVVQKTQYPWFVPSEDKELITLEHVLPENPNGNWPQFSEEEHAAYWRRIGNLCLLPKSPNCDLRSSSEREKFEVYKNAPYELTRQISDVAHWTKESICERQRELAKLSLKSMATLRGVHTDLLPVSQCINHSKGGLIHILSGLALRGRLALNRQEWRKQIFTRPSGLLHQLTYILVKGQLWHLSPLLRWVSHRPSMSPIGE